MAALKKVRDALKPLQVNFSNEIDVVFEGRDLGTVVFPYPRTLLLENPVAALILLKPSALRILLLIERNLKYYTTHFYTTLSLKQNLLYAACDRHYGRTEKTQAKAGVAIKEAHHGQGE